MRSHKLLTAAPLNDLWTARLEQRRRVSLLYPDFAVVASAAERHLRHDDATWSVWLFGSRARGTARADSDWDVALITSSYIHEQRESMAYAPTLQCGRSDLEINCIRIPVDIFLKNRLAFPHIAWAVAGEGIPLAQRQWRLPIHQSNEAYSMDLTEYNRHLSQTRDRLNLISNAYETLANPNQAYLWGAMCDRLQDETQRMAEGFIKAGCMQRGDSNFPRTHDFNEIAERVRTQLRDEDFAATIESLNGNSADDNLIRYFPSHNPEALGSALDRLCNLCDAIPREFHRHAAAFRRTNQIDALSSLNELAQSTLTELALTQAKLARLKDGPTLSAIDDANTAERIRRAWHGIEPIQRAMSRAERDIGIQFRLRGPAENENDREVGDD